MTADAFEELLGELHCPYCGSGFEIESGHHPAGSTPAGYGIIGCGCYRYPVVEGIPVLWQRSGPADIRDEAVAHLERGDFDGAREACLRRTAPPVAPRRRNYLSALTSLLRAGLGKGGRRRQPEGESFRASLGRLRSATYADYLYHRHANNSLLGAVPLIALLGEMRDHTGVAAADGGRPRILDLACGVGHSTFLMHTLHPGLDIVAADHDLGNLLLARSRMVPGLRCVCIDAEAPLPFAEDSFDGVFCMDAFHYLRSKMALVAELDRVIRAAGLWLFPHLHNAAGTNISAGIPLTVDGYRRCFARLPIRVLPESEVLAGFWRDGGLDLATPVADSVLARSDTLSLVGSRRPEMWRHYPSLDAALSTVDRGTLAINPIYRVEPGNGTLRLTASWPNPRLEAECSPVKEFLPAECEIDAGLWQRIRSGGELSRQEQDDLRRWIRSFVLVHLPRGYSHHETTPA